ncbi:MAG: NAD-dependent epimerase/dehydratase family protein [Nitrospira sp.]|nr:NAD-dependent epimerase/dehydratase family protein [Nitrospira sp.]
MRILVTGASGFVGAHVARVLVDQQHDVSALVRPTSDLGVVSDLRLKPILGSLTDHASVERAVQGMDLLFHVAADYRLWVPDPQAMHDVNVGGTRRLLEAACHAGVKRIVYTSSAVTVQCSADRLGTEEDFLAPEAARSTYQRTKILAEQAVWKLIREGAPITIVNPSTPIGALDRRPTPTGQFIVDFLNGRLPAFLEAAFNWIAVKDVAVGHWLAATQGRVGERYILAYQNLPFSDFLGLLGRVSRRPPPRIKIPYFVALCAGAGGELVAKITGQVPRASLDGVRMAKQPMRYDSRKAVTELGLPQTPLQDALEQAVRWFTEQGYVKNGRKV